MNSLPAQPALAPLRIQLFGNFCLFYDDKPLLALNKPRLQSLLAYLILHRRTPQPRSHLAFLFWPDTTEKQAQTNLRHILHLLRKSLPEEEHCLELSSKTVQWQAGAPYTLDVAIFEEALAEAMRAHDPQARIDALCRAAALYEGDLLPTLYDDWIESERVRYQQIFTASLEELILALMQGKEYTRALSYAQRLLQLDPLREESYRTLMQLHAANQDRANALHVYHTCVRMLERELEVEPSSMTQALYADLLQPAAQEITPPRLATVAVQPAFIGRRLELQSLQAVWEAAAQGQAHLVLIRGESGIGKTRLAEELLAQVMRQGAITGRARAYATTGTLAYAPLVEWLQTPTIRIGLRQLDPVWLSELARLLPDLLVEDPQLARPEPLTASWQRQRLFEAITYALRLAGISSPGERPLLLLFDDLQWADAETLDYLHFLLMRHPQARLLIVATVQSEALDEEHSVHRWQALLARHGRLSEVELGLLSQSETAQLSTAVAAHELDEGTIQQLYLETAGQPLFVIETVRARLLAVPGQPQASAEGRVKETTLPAAVRAVIQTRLAQLPPPTRDLLGLAAVLGREFTFDLLASASQLDESTLIRRLDELWRKRIIREHGASSYDFVHDKVREVAYAALGLVQRKQMHRRVAETLQQMDSAAHLPASSQLAFHYEVGGVPEKAVYYYQLAGETAQQLYANAEAIRHYRNAIRLWPLAHPQAYAEVAHLHERVGDISQIMGQTQATRLAYQQALDLLPASEVVWRAKLLPKMGHAWELEYQYDQALDLYTQAEALLHLQTARDGQWWQTWLQIQLERIWACYWLNRYEQAEQVAQAVAAIIESTATPSQQVSYWMALGTVAARRQRYAPSREWAESCRRALAISLTWNEPGHIAWSRFGIGFALLFNGELDEAEQQMQAALLTAQQRGDVVHQARCLTYITVLHRRRGHVAETDSYAQRSLQAAENAHTTEYVGTAHANLAWVSWQQGEQEQAKQHALQAIGLWATLPKAHGSCAFQWTALMPLMAHRMAQSELADAIICARAVLDPAQQQLPALLSARLTQAIAAWDAAGAGAAKAHLTIALDLMRRFAYL